MRAEQGGGQERGRIAPFTARAARCGEAPFEQLTQPAVDLAAASFLAIARAVLRELEQGGPARTEPFIYAPDTLRLDLEIEANARRLVAVPIDEFLVSAGAVGQEQRRADCLEKAGLAELVGPVQKIQPGAEGDVGLPDAREVLHFESTQPHG